MRCKDVTSLGNTILFVEFTIACGENPPTKTDVWLPIYVKKHRLRKRCALLALVILGHPIILMLGIERHIRKSLP